MAVKTALAALVGGVVLSVGSCAPFGISIYRSFYTDALLAMPLEVGVSGRSGRVQIPAGKRARVAIRADIQTPSVQEVDSSGSKEYKPRYRFPVSYTVAEGGGRVLRAGKQPVAWDEGTRSTSNEKASSTGATLTVEQSFEKFPAPASGVIEVEAQVEADDTYRARISKLELLVYGGLENEGPYVVAGLVMLIGGCAVAVIGMVFLLAAAASSSTAAPAAAGIAAGVSAAVEAQPAGAGSSAAQPGPESRQRAILCHLSGFLGYLVPFASVIGPLILWLGWRERDEFVNEQGREALNFQLSVLIYAVVSAVLILLLVGILLLIAVAIFQVAFMVAAAVAASNGRSYRYPLTLRLVK